ncbi:MAG: fibronectin type III domain-containing protein [Nitrosopumilus sp.]|nr:fibronectin type III domain-containing protein [Nitrosopumilus sp.]MDH3822445.1 fibronectin type III domain-containing protein [Nitrosopumilus sp.]MDH3833136.1 fibronectin type III domain-containing protein [Nitrosopumilus sp.]
MPILSALLLFSLSIGIFTSAFAEIDTDKSVYSNGELVMISGTIDLQDDQTVNIIEIEITNLNDNNKIVNEYTPIDDDNAFSKLYDSTAWPIGEYEVTISYNDVEETAKFEISGPPSSSDDDSNDTDNNDDHNTQQQESSSFTSSNSVPHSPTNLKANVISSTQIDLSWSVSDNSDDDSITGYKIEVRTNTDPNYSVIVANTGSTDTTYSHNDLISDTVYAYRVSAINSVGESEPSSSTTVKTSSSNDNSSIDTSNLSLENTDTPTDVVAKAISPTSVELSWNPPTQTYGQAIQGYTIKQELVSDVYDEIVSTTGSTTKYMITNLETNETYTFVVSADYVSGSSDVSEKATVTLTPSSDNDNAENNDNELQSNDDNNSSSSVLPDDVPDSPTDLRVRPISSTQIDLLWTAPENDDFITGYKIEVRTTNAESYSLVVDDTENTDTTYSNTGLMPETTYIYRVFAINEIGISEPSGTNLANTLPSDSDDENNNTQQENESASTQDDDSVDDSNTLSLSTTVPSVPVDLQAIVISQSRINLSWSPPIDNGDSPLIGYKIESKTSDESDYSILITNTGSPSTTTYSHTGLTAGMTHQYRVYAINSSGESGPSDTVEATLVLANSVQTDAQQQSSSTLQVTLNTDKSVYGSDDSIVISGTTNDSNQIVPLGMRIVSSDGKIVYARSISVHTDKTFETTISPSHRQTPIWQNDEFTVEVTYNGRVQAKTTFETESSDVIIENTTSSSDQSKTESNEQQQSPPLPSTSESTSTVSNNELETLKNQNTALQSANQQLQDENNQLKTQIEELNKRVETLDAIVKEQIRVIMETLGALKSSN